ncbi:hypothetical protein DM860_014905 [Cuscuta australis]|uniref:Uncharacterized protein n=1 Tax=Cuscuta australis TaxID=267555 RepID=A0A328E605_9ASTE|nr:hypothetical protein DM860_014905 [Cuscuta australis]
MAAQDHPQLSEKIFSSYIGLSFTLFLGHLPTQAFSLVSSLQARNKELTLRLIETEEQLKQVLSRRKEDSKANARVVEIFASHRHAWQKEERKLLLRIQEGGEEIERLRGRVQELENSEVKLKECLEEMNKEMGERDEMLSLMGSTAISSCEIEGGIGRVGVSDSERMDFGLGAEEFFSRSANSMEEVHSAYGGPKLFSSASNFWPERASPWQDMKYDTHGSLYNIKHFVARREVPWKVDGESAGVSSKLKLLEQELLILERIGKADLSMVPSLLRKQAKRYQSLSGKIDDLCRRMQASDPVDPTLSSEFRTQRQTEYLLEAFRLQQQASEAGQKLLGLHAEMGKGCCGGDGTEDQPKLATRRSFDSIRNNFRNIQRNLEIWLARIIGDVEGILARDGTSCVRDYYMSRYPFVQE